MGRAPCCDKIGLKKGRWTAEEDETLIKYITTHGEGSWRSLPKNAGLLRCGKSCRLRWINYLRSDLKRGNITPEEEKTIIKLHASLGNRWSVIAGHLPGRTDNEIKNYWNSHLSRRILHNNTLIVLDNTSVKRKAQNLIKSDAHEKINQHTREESCISSDPKQTSGSTESCMQPNENNFVRSESVCTSESVANVAKINEEFDNELLDFGIGWEEMLLPWEQLEGSFDSWLSSGL